MRQDNVTFSAFWNVPDNPKATAKMGHLEYAKATSSGRSLPDYFISEQAKQHNFSCSIYTAFNELPSIPYLNNLRENCLNNRRVFLKSGIEIKSNAFVKLATIWTSKVLLFNTIASKVTNTDYITWIDCIFRKDFSEIVNHEHRQTIMISQYDDSFSKFSYRGMVPISDLPKQKLRAQVIKIPTKLLPEVTEEYINCLIRVDRNFKIFDEEVVLSVMNEEHPELFTVISSTKTTDKDRIKNEAG